MEIPVYRNRSLSRIKSLSRRLSVSQADLLRLAEDADTLYSLPKKPKLKPDGTIKDNMI